MSPMPIPTPMPAGPSAAGTPAGNAPVATGPAGEPAVRVYVLNGVDAFGFAELRPLADRLRNSGYPDTRYGGWYQSRQFEREIRQLPPGTPVAVIGYSFGTYRAKAMANRLVRDGIPVVMVGYIGGDYLRNTGSAVPNGVRVVNVTGNGFLPTGRNMFFNGTDLAGASNLRLPGIRHFDLPKQQQTYDALIAGLNGSPSAPNATGTTPMTATSPQTSTSAYPEPADPEAVAPMGTGSLGSPAAMAAGLNQTQSTKPTPSRPLYRLVGRK